jgi:hypothetical protein
MAGTTLKFQLIMHVFYHSSAHGNLENVEQLLSSGRVALSISLEISKEEFSVISVQSLLKEALVHTLGSDVHEDDVSIVSISDDLQVSNISTEGCTNRQEINPRRWRCLAGRWQRYRRILAMYRYLVSTVCLKAWHGHHVPLSIFCFSCTLHEASML